MEKHQRPTIVFSRCLGFDTCRYNGQSISDPAVEALKKHVNAITVCPEMEIGLGVPRDPIRIILLEGEYRLYQPASGRDVTDEMNAFTESYLDSLGEVDGFLLKYKSPSCGPWGVKVYDGYSVNKRPLAGPGFFGGRVMERFSGLPVEEEPRLSNFSIREYFYTRIFTLARFRQVRDARSMKDLIKFHENNKYLFMAHNQARLRQLGRIAANHEKLPMERVLSEYEKGLRELFVKVPSYRSWINVLQHVYGGMSKKLSDAEKKYFLDTVEEYRDERIPLSVPVHLIKSWALRFEENYLLGQTFLDPFPLDLTEITDSGKGRKL